MTKGLQLSTLFQSGKKNLKKLGDYFFQERLVAASSSASALGGREGAPKPSMDLAEENTSSSSILFLFLFLFGIFTKF